MSTVSPPSVATPMAAVVVVLVAAASLLGLGAVSHLVRGQLLLARFGESHFGSLIDHLRFSWPVSLGLLVSGAAIAWMGHRVAAVWVLLLVYVAPSIDLLWSTDEPPLGIVSTLGAIDAGSVGLALAAVEAVLLVSPALVIGRLARPARLPLDAFSALAAVMAAVPVSIGIWYAAVFSAFDGRVDPHGATVVTAAVVVGFVAAGARLSAGLLLALSYAVVARRSFLPDPYPLLSMGALFAGMMATQAAEVFRAGWPNRVTTAPAGSRRAVWRHTLQLGGRNLRA